MKDNSSDDEETISRKRAKTLMDEQRLKIQKLMEHPV